MPPSLIEVRDLARTHQVGDRPVRALNGVSFSIAQGELVAIMGPSGSGKSTLLNLLGCLDRPNGGSYRLDGVDTGQLAADALASLRNRKIGFCFQSFNLLPRATALDNVCLPLVYGGVDLKLRRARAAAMLDAVGLANRADHRPDQLSGGQQQRVAIARALVAEPAVILADEPTGSLDSRSGAEIMGILERLNRDGLTVVLVTHDPAVAGHAHRLIELHDGRLVADHPTASAALPPGMSALRRETA